MHGVCCTADKNSMCHSNYFDFTCLILRIATEFCDIMFKILAVTSV